MWEGSLGPDSFEEPIDEFPLERKSDFTRERPFRSYDKRIEDWPKCRHGLDCVVQMYNDCDGGGLRQLEDTMGKAQLSSICGSIIRTNIC